MIYFRKYNFEKKIIIDMLSPTLGCQLKSNAHFQLKKALLTTSNNNLICTCYPSLSYLKIWELLYRIKLYWVGNSITCLNCSWIFEFKSELISLNFPLWSLLSFSKNIKSCWEMKFHCNIWFFSTFVINIILFFSFFFTFSPFTLLSFFCEFNYFFF